MKPSKLLPAVLIISALLLSGIQSNALARQVRKEERADKLKIAQDDAIIKADRKTLQNAKRSRNRASIRHAKAALNKDMRKKKADQAEIKRQKKQRRAVQQRHLKPMQKPYSLD